MVTSYSAMKRAADQRFVPAAHATPPASDASRADAASARRALRRPPTSCRAGGCRAASCTRCIEELPLATLARAPRLRRTGAALPEVAALFEQMRRRHDRSPRTWRTRSAWCTRR